MKREKEKHAVALAEKVMIANLCGEGMYVHWAGTYIGTLLGRP